MELRNHWPLRLYLLLVFALALTACTIQYNTHRRPTPSDIPTLTSWQRFTYPITHIFSVDYPMGWDYAPPQDNEVIIGSSPSAGTPIPLRQDVLISIVAYTDKLEIGHLCPNSATISIIGLPAKMITYTDTLDNPVYEWDMANSSVAIRFIVDFSSPVMPLKYKAVYTHMLNSLDIASQYANAAPCKPA